MDKNTKDALTQIVEAQSNILRALQIIALIPPEDIKGGVMPLVEKSIGHLEEAIKAIKNG